MKDQPNHLSPHLPPHPWGRLDRSRMGGRSLNAISQGDYQIVIIVVVGEGERKNLHRPEKGWFSMAKRDLIERKTTDQSELCLWVIKEGRRTEYEIIMNGVFIMASYNQLSSEQLVNKPMERLKFQHDVHILIGGLGMGFSAKEACSFPYISHIDVVEIESIIIGWNRTYFSENNHGCLDDPRIHMIVEDFYDYVMETPNTYDLICMDIDNGPGLLVKETNQRVYQPSFFRGIKEIMEPHGIFSIWAYEKDEDLVGRIKKIFPNCSVEEVVEKNPNRELSYYIYLAH